MFIHAVLLRFQPTADDAFHLEMLRHCARIVKECDGLFELYFGRNEASRSGGFDHTVIGRFSTSAAHDAYQVSEAHQSMKAYMTPYIEKLVVVDAEIGDSQARQTSAATG